jgi:hypothetical protein
MEDILKLIKEQFLFCKIRWNEETRQSHTELKQSNVELEGDYIIYVTTPFEDDKDTASKSYCYIKKTRRNFINLFGTNLESRIVHQLQSKENYYIVVFDEFAAAWSIEPEPYIEMSKKYHVDIRIMGWEQGIGFRQDIVIVNGEIIRNVTDDYGGYDSWMWESALPYVGG